MYISVQDIVVFFGVMIALIVGAYLIVTLRNVNSVVTGIQKNILENKDTFRSIIDNMNAAAKNINSLTTVLQKNQDLLQVEVPGSLKNIHDITSTLKQTSLKVDRSIEVVNSSLVETAVTVTENTQDVLTYIKIVSEGIRILIDTLKKD